MHMMENDVECTKLGYSLIMYTAILLDELASKPWFYLESFYRI